MCVKDFSAEGCLNAGKVDLDLFQNVFVFADVLADNGRLPLTGDVISAYSKMLSAHRGEVICSVTTAQVDHVHMRAF